MPSVLHTSSIGMTVTITSRPFLRTSGNFRKVGGHVPSDAIGLTPDMEQDASNCQFHGHWGQN